MQIINRKKIGLTLALFLVFVLFIQTVLAACPYGGSCSSSSSSGDSASSGAGSGGGGGPAGMVGQKEKQFYSPIRKKIEATYDHSLTRSIEMLRLYTNEEREKKMPWYREERKRRSKKFDWNPYSICSYTTKDYKKNLPADLKKIEYEYVLYTELQSSLQWEKSKYAQKFKKLNKNYEDILKEECIQTEAHARSEFLRNHQDVFFDEWTLEQKRVSLEFQLKASEEYSDGYKENGFVGGFDFIHDLNEFEKIMVGDVAEEQKGRPRLKKEKEEKSEGDHSAAGPDPTLLALTLRDDNSSGFEDFSSGALDTGRGVQNTIGGQEAVDPDVNKASLGFEQPSGIPNDPNNPFKCDEKKIPDDVQSYIRVQNKCFYKTLSVPVQANGLTGEAAQSPMCERAFRRAQCNLQVTHTPKASQPPKQTSFEDNDTAKRWKMFLEERAEVIQINTAEKPKEGPEGSSSDNALKSLRDHYLSYVKASLDADESTLEVLGRKTDELMQFNDARLDEFMIDQKIKSKIKNLFIYNRITTININRLEQILSGIYDLLRPLSKGEKFCDEFKPAFKKILKTKPC